MQEYARALAESLVAQASAFEAEGRPAPAAVRLTAEEWRMLKEFLAPLLEADEEGLFGLRVEVVEVVGEGERFVFGDRAD